MEADEIARLASSYPQKIYLPESSKGTLVETDDPELTLFMREKVARELGQPFSPLGFNPTPSAAELSRETSLLQRRGYGEEETAFYEKLNSRIQEMGADPFFRRPGMLSVNANTGRPDNANHSIFWRRSDEEDKIRIFIYDSNDFEERTPTNYTPSFTPLLRAAGEKKVEFIHPLVAREISLNHGYGAGVCRAISFSLSRLWGKIEEQGRHVAVPKMKGGVGAINRVRVRRIREKFDYVISSWRVSAKVLIRLALGADYYAINRVLNGEQKPPKMEHAYENLKKFVETSQEDLEDEEEVDEDELPVFMGAGAGAGAGAGGAGHGMVWS